MSAEKLHAFRSGEQPLKKHLLMCPLTAYQAQRYRRFAFGRWLALLIHLNNGPQQSDSPVPPSPHIVMLILFESAPSIIHVWRLFEIQFDEIPDCRVLGRRR